MSFRKCLFALALAAIAGTTVPACADELATILKSKVLRVAVPQDFPPFGFAGLDLQAQGYDIDVAAMIAHSLGVRLETVPVTSANRVLYLKTRKVDLIISNLGWSPERAKVIDFSETYAPYFNGVFGPAEIAVTKFTDLAGRTIGVARGSFEDLQVSAEAPASAVIKRYDDQNGTISAFLTGQVELIGSGNVVAAAILKRNPPKRPEIKFLIKESPCHIGVNQGEKNLLEKINSIIAEAKHSGWLDQTSLKWLGAKIPKDL